MKKLLGIAAFIAALVLVFTGCPTGGDDTTTTPTIPTTPTTEYWTVTFDLNGGGQAITQRVEKGTVATRPQTPAHTSPGYTFVDWFEASDANPDTATPFDFTTPITANKTLYAIWDFDSEEYYQVTFNDGADTKNVSVSKTGSPKATAPTDAKYQSQDFLGWFTSATADPETDTPYDFDTVLTSDLELWAKWKAVLPPPAISDIVLIGNPATTEYSFVISNEIYNNNSTLDKGGKAAILVEPSSLALESGQYRMQVNFDPAVDISEFGTIEMDFEIDGTKASAINFNITFMLDGGASVPFYGLSSADSITHPIGEALHFKSKDLTGFEIWSEADATVGNLYITRFALTGTAIPEPELGDTVEATGLYISTDAANGTSKGTTLSSADIKDGNYVTKTDTDGTQLKRIYVNFDPLGETFNMLKLAWTYGPQGGESVFFWSAYDAVGEKAGQRGNDNFGDWIGWYGWNNADGSLTFDPAVKFTGIDKATLKSICLELGLDSGNTPGFTITGVTFYKGEIPTEPLPDFVTLEDGVLFENGAWAEDVDATFDTGAIQSGVIPIVADAKMIVDFDPPIDIRDYGAMVVVYSSTDSSRSFIVSMDMSDSKRSQLAKWDSASPVTMDFETDFQNWGGSKVSATSGLLSKLEIYHDKTDAINLDVTKIYFTEKDTVEPPEGLDGFWTVFDNPVPTVTCTLAQESEYVVLANGKITLTKNPTDGSGSYRVQFNFSPALDITGVRGVLFSGGENEFNGNWNITYKTATSQTKTNWGPGGGNWGLWGDMNATGGPFENEADQTVVSIELWSDSATGTIDITGFNFSN